jgi:hypothetical protein
MSRLARAEPRRVSEGERDCGGRRLAFKLSRNFVTASTDVRMRVPDGTLSSTTPWQPFTVHRRTASLHIFPPLLLPGSISAAWSSVRTVSAKILTIGLNVPKVTKTLEVRFIITIAY